MTTPRVLSVTEQLRAQTADPAAFATAQQSIANKRGEARLRTAFEQRDKHGPAKPTGVRIRTAGSELDVYDDGSVRHAWKRKPGLSGRQFRKLRKSVNRNLRKQAAAK